MSEPGKFAPGLTGFPTPNTADESGGYLLFLFPDLLWAQYILGACRPLVYEDNWYEAGSMLPGEASEAFRLIVEQAPYNTLEEQWPTPFWDDATDVEDEASAEDQIWYGEVTDPDAPAGELDFVENVSIWAVTGMVALATGSIGAALAFHTFVEKFVLIQKAGDVGETIRFVIDNQDAATIDTTGHAGELMEVTITGDPDVEEHQLYIIKTS